MSNKEKLTWRDYLWNYPIYLYRTVKATAPLSYIVIFSVIAVYIFLSIVTVSVVSKFTESSPDTVVEGVVGSVVSLNPIFVSQNQVDRDIHSLLFEKLIELDKEGNPVENIAIHWHVSEDGLIYDFFIDTNLTWHDGTPLTVEDIEFTFNTAIILYSKYSKVTVGQAFSDIVIEVVDSNTVRFTLEESNATIFEALSVYIVPKHLLEDVPLRNFEYAYFNDFPIGSGEYKFVSSDEAGVILESVSEVGIRNYIYRTYSSYNELEVAFKNGELDIIGNASISQLGYIDEYSDLYNTYTTPLDHRKKVVYVNNMDGKLANASLRRGLTYLTDKALLLEQTDTSGVVTHSPLAESSWAYATDGIDYLAYNAESAVNEMLEAGYLKDKKSGYYKKDDTLLSLKLSYLETPTNTVLVEKLKELWDLEGVVLTLDPQDYDQLTKQTLATRNFELLLFEIEITIDPDQYNLWHSLRIDYPNLNISGYSFNRVDVLLEKGRKDLDINERKESYSLIQKFLVNDAPVIFLYEPEYVYVVSERISNVNIDNIKFPAERFENVGEWELE